MSDVKKSRIEEFWNDGPPMPSAPVSEEAAAKWLDDFGVWMGGKMDKVFELGLEAGMDPEYINQRLQNTIERVKSRLAEYTSQAESEKD
jgi:hypothetical protein